MILISKAQNSNDDLFGYFNLDQSKGILCYTAYGTNLMQKIINSRMSYIDPLNLNYTSYNLNILASNILISQSQSIAYQPNNNSFNYFKVCVSNSKYVLQTSNGTSKCQNGTNIF